MNKSCTKYIFLVDDDEIAHVLCEKIAESLEGIKIVHHAYNGYEAVKILERCYQGFSEFPDLILLDLHMPIMNGIESIEAFQALPYLKGRETTIAVLSSSENPSEYQQVKLLGIHHFIQKPISTEKLKNLLNIEFGTAW